MFLGEKCSWGLPEHSSSNCVPEKRSQADLPKIKCTNGTTTIFVFSRKEEGSEILDKKEDRNPFPLAIQKKKWWQLIPLNFTNDGRLTRILQGN